MTLAVANLTTRIKGRTILKDLSMTIEPGWFGLLGVNGSGKTTLLKTLCARLDLSAGTIVWQGQDLTDSAPVRAQIFGFAPPLDTLPPTVTAGELIALMADLRGCDTAQPRAIYQALGLEFLRDKRIGAMSSGMKQRVSVFCAFLGEPELILLDEPFNWLDPVAAYELKREIRNWVDHGNCVITALHDVGTFVTRCDDGVLIHGGEIVRTFDRARMHAGRQDIQVLEDEVYALFPREDTVS